jgi:sulfate transport system substrate-binding protein
MKIPTWLVRSLIAVSILTVHTAWAERSLTNVSYHGTHEFYRELNQEFVKYWKSKTNETVSIQQFNDHHNNQVKAIYEGLEADVVNLADPSDVDKIARELHLLPVNWQSRLPHNSMPYTSTILFLVSKGNPKKIKDWSDLIRDDVSVMTSNPRGAGGGRYNYLAAWNYAEKKLGGKEAASAFVKKLYKRAPVLDHDLHMAMQNFAERGLGDVLLAWENCALMEAKEVDLEQFDIVVPPASILVEPAIAVLDKMVEKHKNRDLADAYVEYLYSPEGQRLFAKYYYRPVAPELLDAKQLPQFPKINLSSVKDMFGSWDKARKEHLDNGGTSDQVFSKK